MSDAPDEIDVSDVPYIGGEAAPEIIPPDQRTPVDDDLGEGAAAEPVGEEPRPTPPIGAMSDELFYRMFLSMFSNAGRGVLLVRGVELQTLKAVKSMEDAREVSDAIYDSCCDIPFMHWLIKPGSGWAARAFVIGGFGLSIYMGVSAELAAAAPAESGEAPAEGSKVDLSGGLKTAAA